MKNICDKCKNEFLSNDLIWITTEDFQPKEDEIVPDTLYKKYDALCEDCYYEEIYTVLKNNINKEASFNGCLYETFGEELKYIKKFPNKNQIWTVLEEDGFIFVLSGIHFVNRLGYFITEQSVSCNVYGHFAH